MNVVRKIGERVCEKCSDRMETCDFISKVLMQLFFYPILLVIIGMWLVYSFGAAGETSDSLFMMIIERILLGIAVVWVFVGKAYLLIIPIVFIIQCVELKKTGKCSRWMGLNFVVWIFIGLMALYATGVHTREDECMSWCVSEDGANYNECLFSVCDFPI